MNLRDLKLRARAVLSPGRVESDLREELAFHVDREAARHVALGKTPAEARALAVRKFGSPTVAADECRDARGTALLDNLVRDLLFAGRSFRPRGPTGRERSRAIRAILVAGRSPLPRAAPSSRSSRIPSRRGRAGRRRPRTCRRSIPG